MRLIPLFLLFTSCLFASDEKPKILKFFTPKEPIVEVTFDTPHLIAICDETEEKFVSMEGTLSLPLLVDMQQRKLTNFTVFSPDREEELGGLTFCFSPHTLPDVISSYMTCNYAGFELPLFPDKKLSISKYTYTRDDQRALWNALYQVLPDAFSYLITYARTINPSKDQSIRAALEICRFMWACGLEWGFHPPPQHLPLKEQIEVLKAGNYPVDCGGLSTLFSHFLTILMPLVSHRKVAVFDCDPDVSNIHTDSHTLIELFLQGKWQLVDPSYQFILKNPAGEILSVQDVRNRKQAGALGEIAYWHLETADPTKTALFNAHIPLDVSGKNGYFKNFNCLTYYEFVHK